MVEEQKPEPEGVLGLPFMDQSLPADDRALDLLGRLTFEEKITISAGFKDNVTDAIPRLHIPPFRMADGPHGIAPYALKTAGPNGTQGTATYFPTGIQMASTWNPDLIGEFGKAIGEEMRVIGWQMLLGPAVNLARTPMNGRTFEYYSEDPYLAGKIGAAAVRGIQSQKIATCVKHYAVNNQEHHRFTVSAQVSRRALEELYLRQFAMIVKESDPWGVMSSYNRINGRYVSENKDILRETLMNRFGFSGAVVSDWGATKHCELAGLIEAGLSVEMGSRDKITIDAAKALKDAGKFPEAAFDDNVRRYLRVMVLCGQFDDPSTLPEGSINTDEHVAVARRIAEEGMVLLKNEGNLLPLDDGNIKKIALVGKHADIKFAVRPNTGGGSSMVGAHHEVTVREGLKARFQGKGIEIVDDPSAADVAIACIGLEHTHDFKGGDHEGSDKLRFSIGFTDAALVRNTAKKNKNTVVVLVNGSPFGMESFVDTVPAVLEAWYGGEELGTAVAEILFGDVNPSGKLPVTFPKRLKDVPAHASKRTYPGIKDEVFYDEGMFIGYRHFDTRNVEPRFPFGHGLSYTAFTYGNLSLDPASYSGEGAVSASFDITNEGERAGAEIVQLYVQDDEASKERPSKELKGFSKVFLVPGEIKTVTLELGMDALSFFDERANGWVAEPGAFTIKVGSSSRDIRLEARLDYAPLAPAR